MADNDNAAIDPVGANGMTLMGLTPPVVAQKTEEVPAAPVTGPAPDVPETAREAGPANAGVPVSPAPESAQKSSLAVPLAPVDPPTAAGSSELADLVRNAAAALNKVADKLS
jgi:hypothetical protein